MPKQPVGNLIPLFPPFSPMKVKYKDVFDLKAFYENFKEWLTDQGWHGETNDGKFDFDHWETLYAERIDRTGAKELWIRWRPVKEPEKAPFLKYYWDINYRVTGMSSVEIVKEGRKIKADKGEMEITIRAFIEEKYKSEFEKKAVLKQVKDLFAQRVYKKTLEDRKKELYQETYVLQNWIKQWFKMKRYLPYEEAKGFYTSQAWPSHVKE